MCAIPDSDYYVKLFHMLPPSVRLVEVIECGTNIITIYEFLSSFSNCHSVSCKMLLAVITCTRV